MNWDPNPIINRKINIKRTTLSIRYNDKIEKWLVQTDYPSNDAARRKFRKYVGDCKMVIEGKSKTVTLNMLNRIETVLEKLFERMEANAQRKKVAAPVKVAAFVDLTEDDQEDPSSIQTHPSPPGGKFSDTDFVIPALSSPGAEPCSSIPQAVHSSTSIPPGPSNLVQSFAEPVVPLPLLALPTTVLPLFTENSEKSATSVSTERNEMPKRRKSVSSRPPQSVANEPLISTYKIKNNKLKPPCVYAKPNEGENQKPRNIITVPYKTAPKQTQQVPYDPKEQSMKLEGIKQKIYADKFLSFDAQKKEDLKKKFIEEQEIAVSAKDIESDSDSSDSPKKAPRKGLRKRIISPPPSPKEISGPVKAIKTTARNKLKRSKEVETSNNTTRRNSTKRRAEKIPDKTPVATKVQKITAKKTSNIAKKSTSRLASSKDEEDCEVPAHVFEGIERDLAELFSENQSSTRFPLEVVQFQDNADGQSSTDTLPEVVQFQDNADEQNSTNTLPEVVQFQDNADGQSSTDTLPEFVKLKAENPLQSSTSVDSNMNETNAEIPEHESSMSLLLEIPESEAYRPPKKRGRKKGFQKRRPEVCMPPPEVKIEPLDIVN